MVSTAQIAANAKLNFRHEDCWFVFTSSIKPQIEELISSYFADWQRIERDVQTFRAWLWAKLRACLDQGVGKYS
jgi:hypothetical protein